MSQLLPPIPVPAVLQSRLRCSQSPVIHSKHMNRQDTDAKAPAGYVARLSIALRPGHSPPNRGVYLVDQMLALSIRHEALEQECPW